MNDQIILGAQVITALGYIISLFVLYRLLVSQKDATIELLKEKIGFLEEQLDTAKAESPSVLAERLAKHVKLLEDELGRLAKDQDQNEELIREKEQELAQTRIELEEFRAKLEQASEILSDLSCPYCGAVITEMEYFPDSAVIGGKDIDFEHEIISYACGLTIHDGKEVSPCPNRGSTEQAG